VLAAAFAALFTFARHAHAGTPGKVSKLIIGHDLWIGDAGAAAAHQSMDTEA
jgi:hypothetical protein